MSLRLIPALVLVAVAGCTDSLGIATNTPAVGMNAGQFGFAVTARDWTFDHTYTPGLTAGTLEIGLVVAGYTGGTGLVTITDADNVVVFNQTLAGNTANGNNLQATGKAPFKIQIVANDYSGLVSLGINGAPGA